MKPKPPDETTAGAPEPGALRPMPPHDGPYEPAGRATLAKAGPASAAAPDGPEAPPPAIAVEGVDVALDALPTVEEHAERCGLNDPTVKGNRFAKNHLWAREKYAVGQRVSAEAFDRALAEARGVPLSGAPEPERKPARATIARKAVR